MTKTIRYNLIHFRHIRGCLTLDAAKTFMHAMIISHLTYCITCWGQAGETAIKPLESLYKQTLKALDRKSMQFHHCRILQKHHLLSFENVKLFSNLCLSFRILNGLAPPPLRQFVHFRSEQSIKSTRISSTRDCSVPFRRSSFGQSAFTVKATTQWNALPDSIKNCDSIGSFKNKLKNHLLDTQLCNH